MAPQVAKGQGRLRVKIEAGNGIEEVDIEEEHKKTDDPLHYLLRRV